MPSPQFQYDECVCAHKFVYMYMHLCLCVCMHIYTDVSRYINICITRNFWLNIRANITQISEWLLLRTHCPETATPTWRSKLRTSWSNHRGSFPLSRPAHQAPICMLVRTPLDWAAALLLSLSWFLWGKGIGRINQEKSRNSWEVEWMDIFVLNKRLRGKTWMPYNIASSHMWDTGTSPGVWLRWPPGAFVSDTRCACQVPIWMDHITYKWVDWFYS